MSMTRLSAMAAILVVGLLVSRPVHAQQSLSLNLGYFAVRGEDARIRNDVLIENLNLFAFDLRDFNNGTVGGEWLVGLGEYFEAGVGLGYYRRTVPTVYNGFVNFDGTEITQDFRLRVMPVTVSLRVLPFGQRAAVQPYFGGGLGVFNWRYSEVGEFIDFTDLNDSGFAVFRERFAADGTDLGATILGGVRVPVGSRFAIGGELRYQTANGHVGTDQDFQERIDLGGLASQFTFQVMF